MAGKHLPSVWSKIINFVQEQDMSDAEYQPLFNAVKKINDSTQTLAAVHRSLMKVHITVIFSIHFQLTTDIYLLIKHKGKMNALVNQSDRVHDALQTITVPVTVNDDE